MIERTQRLMGGAIEATEYAIQNGGITGNMAGELTMRIVILAQDIVYSMTLPSVQFMLSTT